MFTSICNYLHEFHFVTVLFRLILAMLAGGVIGYGRAKKKRAAGFRSPKPHPSLLSQAHFLIQMRIMAFFSNACNRLALIINAWPSTPCLICSQPILLYLIQLWQPFQFLLPPWGLSHICVFIPEGSPPTTTPVYPCLPNSCLFRSSGSIFSPNRLVW